MEQSTTKKTIELEENEIEFVKRALNCLSLHYHELAEKEGEEIDSSDFYTIKAREVTKLWVRFYDLINE